MNRPHRGYELDIHIGGDTWEDVTRELERLAEHIREHGPACSSVSGSPSAGHTVTIRHDAAMTQARYHAELDAYLRERDAAEAVAP